MSSTTCSESQSEHSESDEFSNEEKRKRASNRQKSEAGKVRKRKLTKKRVLQKFKKEWTDKFKWARASRLSECYFHCLCCHEDRKCGYDGISTLRKHEMRNKHKKSGVQISKNIFEVYQRNIDDKTKAQKIEALAALFLIKKNIPIVDIEDLIELLKAIDIDKSVQKKLMCGRTKCTKIIENVIGKYTLEQLTEILRSTYFSLIIDESTDVAVMKQLVLCVRYMASDEEVHDQFLACLEVSDGTHKGLHKLIVDFFEANKIPYKKLMVGFAADGAGVNFGKDNSVSRLFILDNDSLFVLKCICHSLALGVSHAVKQIPPEIEEFISNVYNYLKHSSKRQQAMQNVQMDLNLPEHKLLQYKKVRWLSLRAAVSRVLEQYDALYAYFKKESESQKIDESSKSARSIFERMKILWTKLYLHFFDFILPIINENNLLFQSEQPRIHQLHGKMEFLFKTIARMYLKNSYVDRVDIEDLDFSLERENSENVEPLRELDLGPIVTTELMKLSLTVSVSEIDKFRINCRNFLVVFLQQLYKRFPFKDKSIKLIRQLGFVDPVNLMDTKNIYFIADFFKLNMVKVNEEFRKLKDMFRLKCDNTSVSSFWKKVAAEVRADGSQEFPLILDIVRRVMVLPHTSADVERIFSIININKTKQRNSMDNDLLTGILHGKSFIKKKPLVDLNVDPFLPYMNKLMYENGEQINKDPK